MLLNVSHATGEPVHNYFFMHFNFLCIFCAFILLNYIKAIFCTVSQMLQWNINWPL